MTENEFDKLLLRALNETNRHWAAVTGEGWRLAFNLDRIAFGMEYYWPALGTCYHPAHDGKPAVLYGKYVTDTTPPPTEPRRTKCGPGCDLCASHLANGCPGCPICEHHPTEPQWAKRPGQTTEADDIVWTNLEPLTGG
jgi:hypothetical protein